jgi:hypothetical protein
MTNIFVRARDTVRDAFINASAYLKREYQIRSNLRRITDCYSNPDMHGGEPHAIEKAGKYLGNLTEILDATSGKQRERLFRGVDQVNGTDLRYRNLSFQS